VKAEGRVYLPLFYDLTGRHVLVVGGGKAAWQKVRALSPFGVSVVVVSPETQPEVAQAGAEGALTLVLKAWDEGDLSDTTGLVLACTADPAVNASVVAAARARGIPALDAARPEAGDFIQPAARRSDGFTLAVSSGGRGPKAAVAVRDALTPLFEAAVHRERRRAEEGTPPEGLV